MPNYGEYAIGLAFILGSVLMLGVNYTWIKSYAKLFQLTPKITDPENLPYAAVILPVRGADPYLEQTINCLFQQDYPLYDIVILADDEHDPAIILAAELKQKYSQQNCQISIFKDFSPDKSLKVSALIAGVNLTNPEVQVVAILDADAQPHAAWLQEIVSPLVTEGHQICCGVRWFCPQKFSWGTIVRQLWNLFAIVQMHAFAIPWGGSLAVWKTSFLTAYEEGYFAGALSEDTTLGKFLIEKQQRLKIVPSLVMVNQEQTNFTGAVRFIRRQMIVARLHHPAWTQLFFWNCLFFVFPLVLYLGLIYGLISSWINLVILSVSTICVVQFTMLYYTYWVANIIHGLNRRGKANHLHDRSTVFPAPWVLLPMLYLTLLVTFCSTVGAHLARRVSWRGIDYTIINYRSVVMNCYKPYQGGSQPKQKQMSL